MKNDFIDPGYFRELAEQDPRDVCNRAGCKYDVEKHSYTLCVWGDDYAVYPHANRVDLIGGIVHEPHEYFSLFIVYHLLRSKEIEVANEWISEKDIPGGSTFFRGPHEIPTRLISGRFGNDIEGFVNRCERLRGSPIGMADAAYRFEITSTIPTAVLYWRGDDEFPPESKLLYDKTVTENFPPDIIFALAVEICHRIGGSINARDF